MLPLPTTPRPRITSTLKRPSTTLQPALPTPTYRNIIVRKRSLPQKKEVPELQCPICHQPIPHRVTDSQLWVNILIFTLSFVSILFFCYLLICLLIFSINVSIYLLFSELWCRAPVGCCILDGWVDCWCSDVSLVWRKPNRNAAAFLHNLRNDQLLYRGLQVLHH
jgi:hypothetical protein